MLPRKQQDLPSSWGTSVIRLPCSEPTPAGLLAPDHIVQQRGPCYGKSKGSHDWVFRRSIAWLSDLLFTLRGVSYLSTTQNSLPVAGQALPGGVRTRKVPMKGFKVVGYISFPLPKLCLAQSHQPRVDRFLQHRLCKDLEAFQNWSFNGVSQQLQPTDDLMTYLDCGDAGAA